MKKTKFRPKLKTLYDNLWKLCREICFVRDKNQYGEVDCYTCTQKNLSGQNRQLGHAYPDGALGVMMAFDLRILRWQCYQCNINRGGMGAIFWKNLEVEIGKDVADMLYLECQRSKGKTTNARTYALELIEKYKILLKEYETRENMGKNG